MYISVKYKVTIKIFVVDAQFNLATAEKFNIHKLELVTEVMT